MSFRRRITQCLILSIAILGTARTAKASGHGPVFGMTTPTNAKGGWSFDLGMMGRVGATRSGNMSRAMLTYGVTPDLQLSVTVPYIFASALPSASAPALQAPLAPSRITGMMSATPDFEGIAAWRFHRQGTDVGTRFESTAYAGPVLTGVQRPKGMIGTLRKAPGIYTAIATGMASRSHYVWAGINNTHFAERSGDRRPNVFTYSLVWGYRPPPLRKEYPHWDWRVFAEMTGDVSNKVRRAGISMPGSAGHQLFLGPTALGIYKSYAIEGGIQLPVYRDVGAVFQREKFRFAVNFSRFF